MLEFRSKALALFYQKLGQLHKAGLPITESFPLAALELRSETLRAGAARAHRALLRGRTLTESLSQSPEAFSELERALIAVGEAHGRLDETFLRLSAVREREYDGTRKLLFALVYPGFLLIAAILLPPVGTWFREGLAAYLGTVARTALFFLAPLAAAYAAYTVLKKYFLESFDRVKLAIPILGGSLRKLALARFSRSLAMLVGGGVELRAGLRLALAAMGNRYLEERASIAPAVLERGASLTDSLRATQVFSGELLQMLAVGERSGDIPQMLEKAAEFQEREARQVVNALLVALPVGLYLLVALYIGYTVISFYAGYFRTTEAIFK